MKRHHISSKIVVLMIAAAFAVSPAYPHGEDRQAKCKAAKQMISKLRTKMRHGYTARQGIRMDDEMRRLKKLRSEYCR